MGSLQSLICLQECYFVLKEFKEAGELVSDTLLTDLEENVLNILVKGNVSPLH